MTTYVSADWVADRIDDPECLMIDTRYSMRHLMGHLKSAVNVPPPKTRDSTGNLLSPDDFAQLFGAAGLGDGITPVLYDGYDGRNSAMVAWVLEYLGQDDVRIMDIVYDEWKSQGREVLYRPVPRNPRQFTPRINPAVRASLDDVSTSEGVKLVDTRTADEYNGQSEADEKPGHIPGALNIIWESMVGEDGKLVCSDEKARRIFEAANIKPSDSLVTYCKIGARAAVGYQAFKRLGYDVRLFDGSYAEWEKTDLPVEL